MSISDKLQTLINGKTELVNTINEKAGTALTVSSPWSDLKGGINCIESGGEGVDPHSMVRSIFDRSITGFSDSVITVLPDYALYSCSKLETLFIPNVTKIGKQALHGCYKLKQLDGTIITTLSSQSCASLRSVETLNFPLIPEVPHNCFGGCVSLKTINIPNATSIGGNGFMDCRTLEKIDLPKVIELGMAVFNGCTTLKTVILRSETICTVTASEFGNTPIKKSDVEGFIYVPDELVEDYKVATNWTLYADKIKPLSELPEEN